MQYSLTWQTGVDSFFAEAHQIARGAPVAHSEHCCLSSVFNQFSMLMFSLLYLSSYAVDHDNGDYPVFESGAILLYLAEISGQLYPQDFNKRHEVNQWLIFQNASMGPMQGQANHFVRYAPEKIEYGQKRYVAETKRVYGVLENRLKDHEWLAAGEYTIAGALTFSTSFHIHQAAIY
jgi:hypothetical protein